jgi:predicted DNA-binding transcriptional regulator AlpA
MEALLNEKQVAETLGLSLAALRRWRYEGRGPKFLKLGSAVRYRPTDVQEWLHGCPSGGSNAHQQSRRLG